MTLVKKATRRDFVRATAGASAFALAGGAPLIARGKAKYTLKIATLAPKGSSWMKAFEAAGRELKKTTDGECVLKLYGGGVMGDEPAMVRKMRTGQLDGAAVTNVGLGDINKQLLMLQLPLLFKRYKDLDRVRNNMASTFSQLLSDEGFILTGWGDVGFVYLFSNRPVRSLADARATKMWVWDADPVSKAVMKIAGINAVPLSVPDVLSSLQTGVIDAFQNSPYGAVALQWDKKAKYITNLKFAVTIGGSVLTTRAFNKLSPAVQAVMPLISGRHMAKLTTRIRRDNKRAINHLTGKGKGASSQSGTLEVVEVEDFAEWKRVAKQVRKKLTGSLFDEALIAEMLSHA